MLYDGILIDVFNLCYKKRKDENNPIDIANNVINYINSDVNSRLAKEGTLYLLFDPLPKSDLGYSKSLTYSTDRQNIVSSYKSNRTHDENVQNAAKLLRKYYAYRGDSIKVCISNNLEADDFVEQIVADNSKKFAMVTTDSDWARYISDNVFMISKDFRNPYTKTDYYNEYGMIPTIATVTVKKALFGDSSDNIPSIKSLKRVKFYTDFDFAVKTALFELSKSEMSLADFKKHLKDATISKLAMISNKNGIENLEFLLLTALCSTADVMETFKDNIRVIESRCVDVKKHIYSNPENENYNKLMEATLNRVKKTKKFSFGKVKI